MAVGVGGVAVDAELEVVIECRAVAVSAVVCVGGVLD